jgi:hypothetical protein
VVEMLIYRQKSLHLLGDILNFGEKSCHFVIGYIAKNRTTYIGFCSFSSGLVPADFTKLNFFHLAPDF